MSIELITGTPGSGKTLFTLWSVKAKAEKENRPVYYSGIADLKLPWTEIEAEKWYDCPANSIIVIDECQRVFRPRSWSGEVPKYVSELETHRHKGLDLVFITQHPMLIDSNVRRLVGNHKHISRRFGLKRSSVFEYETCKDQPLSKIESATARHEWSYPKEVFGYYKSAEVHTVKARIPAKVYVIIGALALVIGGTYMVISRFADRIQGKTETASAGAPGASGTITKTGKNDPYAWYAAHTPRIGGMAHTAPVYDEVTKPVRAPYPAACIQMGQTCKCFTDQGTRLNVDAMVCADIVANGIFIDWETDGTKGADAKPKAAPEPLNTVQPVEPKYMSLSPYPNRS